MEHTVRFLPSQREVRAAGGSSLLEAARRAELPVASACGADGICGRCGLEILEGGDTLPPETESEKSIKTANRVEPQLRLACRVTLAGDLLVTAPYW